MMRLWILAKFQALRAISWTSKIVLAHGCNQLLWLAIRACGSHVRGKILL